MSGAEKSICLLITGLGKGGAEQQLVLLAEHLVSRGWRVSVVSMTPLKAPGHRARLDTAGVACHSLGMKSGAALALGLWQLLRILRRERPRVLLSFMVHANVMGRIAGRLAGIQRIVSSVRNEIFGGRMRERAISVTDRLAHVTTVNSQRAARSLVKRGVIREDRLVVVPNILPVTVARAPDADTRRHIRTEIGVEDGAFLWMAVGNLLPPKDHAGLLAAVAQLPGNSFLAIAGEGPLHSELEERLATLGLTDRVVLLGLRNDVPRLLAAADGFVLSSAWEGLPNVVMEAQAAGLPVVATRVGGVPELVEEGTSGYLVPPRTPDVLADAMARLAALPPAERERMGRAGREAVRRFEPGVIVAAWEAVFERD